MEKLYRKKYLIGVYAPIEEGETLLGLCSNISEFAQLLGIEKRTACTTLHYLFTKQTHFIRYCGKLCTVEFILDVDENIND